MRQPAVQDRFYPGSPETLNKTIEDLLPKPEKSQKKTAIAAISPHAGYIYSGDLAAKTLNTVDIPETVVIIGPNHRGVGAPVALSTDSWNMPLGVVEVDQEFATLLLSNSSNIQQDELAHRYEHSLEVQIPFLQKLQPNLTIAPLVVSHITCPLCLTIATAIAETIQATKKSVLMVASTDMNHYESRETTTRKDRLALQCIQELQPEKLYQTVHDNNISMCGVVPVTIILYAAQILGATSATLIERTDSGAISGDTDQVVGYAGLTIS